MKNMIGKTVEVIDGSFVGIRGVVECIHQGYSQDMEFLRVRLDRNAERMLPEAPLFRREQVRVVEEAKHD